MIANSLLGAAVIVLAVVCWFLQTCTFLIPYRRLLVEQYELTIALGIAVLFVNVFAVLYTLGRTLFLKETGQKLAHLEKQLRAGGISAELAQRLEEDRHGA